MSESSTTPQKPKRQSSKVLANEDQSIYGIDLFLRCLYDYWLHGGLSFLIARKVTRLLKTLTLFAIVVVVVYCIDYKALLTLSIDRTAPSQAIIHVPEMSWTAWCWFVGSSIYFLYNAWKTINQIQQARNIHQFYRTNLGILSDEVLASTPWHVVCESLRKFQHARWLADQQLRPIRSATSLADEKEQMQMFQNSNGGISDSGGGGGEVDGELKEDAHQNRLMAQFSYEAMLTDDNIATMIMRRENYWIALFADNILTFSTPQKILAPIDNADSSESSSSDGATMDSEFHAVFSKAKNSARLDHDDRDLEQGEYPEETELPANRFYVGYPMRANGSTLQRIFQRVKNWLINVIFKPLFITECDRHDSAAVMEKPILTKTLQWCLTYGLFGFAIDSQTGALKHELTLFIEDENTYAQREQKRSNSAFRSARQWHRTNVSQPLTNKLIWRFRAMAIVGALLSPFIFVLVILSFFFEHGDEVRNEPGRSLGTRQWTNEARWAFRRYNELPHHFEARLARGALAAEHYVNSFYFAAQGEIARCVAFVAAAALFIFLIIGAFGDEEALSMIQFAFHRSAFWWITTLSLFVAAARSLVPSVEATRRETLRRHDNDVEEDEEEEEQEQNNDDDNNDKCETKSRFKTDTMILDAVENEFLPTPTPQELCRLVAHFTGYYPRSWKMQEHTEAVRQRFFCLYDSKWIIYLREIAGIIYTPYLLWFVFPEKAQQFLDFFVERTERRHKVGHVCARENTSAINASV